MGPPAAYASAYKHDVFVSYAHLDDARMEGVERGWVTTLVNNLRVRLAQKLGARELSIWMDHELTGNDPLTPEIVETVGTTATLLVVLSQSYLESEWCRRERNAFLQRVAGRVLEGERVRGGVRRRGPAVAAGRPLSGGTRRPPRWTPPVRRRLVQVLDPHPLTGPRHPAPGPSAGAKTRAGRGLPASGPAPGPPPRPVRRAPGPVAGTALASGWGTGTLQGIGAVGVSSTSRGGNRTMTKYARSLTALVAVTTLGTAGLSGCASLNQTERGAVVGAGTGAAVGAVIGKNTGSTARGAILGAVLGGAAGAIIGRQMDRQAEEIEENVDGARVERIGEGIAVTFESGILFPFNSTELYPAGRTNLRKLADILARNPGSEVLIVGHTDNVGSDTYNMDLSQRRAESAAGYLTSQGVARGRVRTAGRGETEPIASNATESGRQANRRVEVAIFASEQYREQILRESRNP